MAGLGSLPLQIAGTLGQVLQIGDVLQLDTIIFDEIGLEVPSRIGSLGGHQEIAEISFPGGSRTQQTFGAFPDTIEWTGYFTGPNAFGRMQQVDLIRVSGREVFMRFGPKAYLGRVQTFTPTPSHRWLIPYHIRFMPRIDISQGLPASPDSTPEEQLNDQTTNLSSLSNGEIFPMPTSLIAPVSGLLSTVSSTLAQVNGIIDNIGSAAAGLILTAGQLVVSTALPLLAAATPIISFMAMACTHRANNIVTITQHPVVQSTVSIQVINPNFTALAAQYLGDAFRWRDIAYYNGLNDPMPIGNFTINIPPANSSPIPVP